MSLTPCLGVMCERHQDCARYAAINGACVPSSEFLAFCGSEGHRIMFVPLPCDTVQSKALANGLLDGKTKHETPLEPA